MKNITSLALILLSGVTVYSQDAAWVKAPTINFNMNSQMVGYSTTTDAQGNVYFLGFKDDAVPYNSIMGKLHFIKYTADGEPSFIKEITGKAASHCIAADSEGNTIIALSYIETITIDDVTLTATSGEKWLLAKFNASGDLVWYEPIELNETEGSDVNEFSAIAVDENDTIYIGYGNFMNSYISVYSKFNNFLYTIEQLNVGRITSLSVDSEGNIYSAGSCSNFNATFAGVTEDSGFAYDTYIAKYSNAGVYQWVKFLEDITCPAMQIVAKSPDEVYFSGNLFTNTMFDDIQSEGPISGFDDFFVARLDAQGNFVWVREVPGSGIAIPGNRNFLDIDSQGNVYFSGSTAMDINWGNGITTNSGTTGRDVIVLQYNPDGDIVRAVTATGDGFNRADAVSVNNNGDLYIAGMAFGDITFGSLTHTSVTGQYYPFLAKMATGTMGIENPEKQMAYLYPNPATDNIYLAGTGTNNVQGTIYNALGQMVKTVTIAQGEPLSVKELPSGIYTIIVNDIQAVKFIKQ
ncbi:T9SS type A sorting domain-containing protein [Flavobacterium sp.]|uniref:T9SS type A sorting domain-containing protein n=1 Tax=Flavobacterium sp. TaxID=239 RepID=UPI002621535A|nr:T9SS type A sorting domain-containing protein [Flavobacterium sp.]